MATTKPRPTSPHVGIYRWQITNTLSILHRMTGIALCAGTVVLVAWLWAAAYSPHAYFYKLQDLISSPIGRVMMMGWTLAFFYHLGNGIRHLFWDAGKGFEIKTVTASGVAVMLFTVIATGLVWGFAFSAIPSGL